MNTKDFVVLPWGKPGHSVKLKYKNAQELRLEKVQLELENQETEKKLQEFQSTRSKEKEGGESSGCHWKAGKAGQLGKNLSQRMSQNRGDFTKLSTGKAKVQLLKEQLQEPVRQPLSYKMVNSSGSVKPKIRGKLCGQCENRAALLICLECGEDYCSRCFAKIHQKGALKLHRTTLLQAKSQILSNVLDVAHRFIKDINPDEPKGENRPPKDITKQHTPTSPLLQGSSSELDVSTATTGECTNPRGRLLCEGPFTEDASAQTSPEVLNERRPACPDREENLPAAKPDSLEGCEVQTSLKIWREPLNIEFKEDSISYMEKLWLKKHRRTPQGELRNVLPETSIPQFTNTSEVHCSHENDEDSDVEETRVQCPALFLPVEELSIERPELSVKIVELNDTYEEEYEEQENIVPYKVELPDAGSQQSSAFHDYQNAFLYENDIHKHHVFTKGKTDLLHHLSKLSSYFEDDPKAGTSNIKFGNNVDPDVYSPAAEKLGESRFFEKHFKEKSIDMGSNQQSDNSCMSFESKDSLPSVDLKIPSIKEKLSQDIKESLEFSNLPERPNLEDVKITESPLLLQEIALRSKPVTEKYQGLERFFVSDKNERLNLLPSHSSEFNSSSTRITITGDRDWVPAHSMSVRADDAVAVGVVRGVENPSWRRTRRETARRHRDLQEQIYHFPTLLKETPAVSPSSPPGSALAPSVCKAASEIAEIECIDATDHSEPLLDSVADQLAFSILEKELNVPRKLADLSEKLYSLTSEDSPTFHNNSLNISQTTLDFFKSSRTRGPCGSEELSSSEKDTETRSFLTLSEGGTDQEKEDLLDKQRVVTAPWPKST